MEREGAGRERERNLYDRLVRREEKYRALGNETQRDGEIGRFRDRGRGIERGEKERNRTG